MLLSYINQQALGTNHTKKATITKIPFTSLRNINDTNLQEIAERMVKFFLAVYDILEKLLLLLHPSRK